MVNKSHLSLLITITVAVYAFLYIPILTLITFSFNADPLGLTWKGFSLHWYRELLFSAPFWSALQTSLLVAGSTVVLSLIMGIGFICFGGQFKIASVAYPLFYLNLAMPEIVLAVSLLAFFNLFSIPLGLLTLIVGHSLLGLGYVVPLLSARYHEIDKRLLEAAQDLGASQIQTFWTVVLPMMMPAVIGGALLVFIISFDDFILSFFCSGASTQTLPLYIFSAIRAGASPQISALSTLLLIGSSMLVTIFSFIQTKKLISYDTQAS